MISAQEKLQKFIDSHETEVSAALKGKKSKTIRQQK